MIVADQVRRGHNVLITCPSHAAVDSLLEKLASLSLFETKDIIRLGHLAKVKKELHKYCLDYKVFGKAKRLITKEKTRREAEVEFLRKAKVVLGTCTTPAPGGILDFYMPTPGFDDARIPTPGFDDDSFVSYLSLKRQFRL